MADEPIQPDLCSRPWCQALKYMLGHGKLVISLHVVDNKVEGYRVDWHETQVSGATRTAIADTMYAALDTILTNAFPTTG